MRNRTHRMGIFALVAVLGCSFLALAEGTEARFDSGAPPLRLLVLDATKTFLSTMRIGGAVGALKGTGLFDVDVRFVDVTSEWHDPLAGERLEDGTQPYDVLLFVPVGLDDRTADWVWVLSDPSAQRPPSLAAGLAAVEQIIARVFEGTVSSMDMGDDLFLAFLHSQYVADGWMR